MTVMHFAECVAGDMKIDLQTILKILKAILKDKIRRRGTDGAYS